MWKDLIALSENKKSVMAKLPSDKTVDKSFSAAGLVEALAEIGARKYLVLDSEVTRFVNCAKESKGEVYEGIVVAEMRNASVEVVLSEQDMLASMVVTGAYGGRGLYGSELVHALAQSHVIKGINKLALKKVLLMSNTLKPGETFTQPVAQGKEAVQGQDAQFIALVDDVTKRVLAPKERKSHEKIDMRNLGETITVGVNEEVMRRKPATKGEPGFTVQGKVIEPKPGNDSALVAGKGTSISPHDPNLLLANQSGMPIIKGKTIDVDNALCLNNVSVATGHVKFKGCVVIAGDVEPGMIVRATGSVTIGGFVESADVQAQGDIEVGKGIIGHTVSEGDDKSCVVKSGGSIKANYAQYATLQAAENVQLAVHSMSNELRCGGDLMVLDGSEKQGTLSGGTAKVGGKIVCLNLGVEGDTATNIEAFARFSGYKERITKHKEQYKQAQEETMDVIRRELEFKKRPKAERTEEEELSIDEQKQNASEHMEKVKMALELLNEEFEQMLESNTVEAKGKVFTHVSIQYGEERVTTKRVHGPSVFTFNQYEIQMSSKLDEEDIGI
ncbi:DUF342 domain-containing protein [Vibrio furnissii]|uniref:DUF342 domain-containing protein n=1 Tax=Vibrio furnissii TaxID=29494 RepID=UPI0025746AC0|nr:FapA family protein [Vibrio furnissii]WJG24628.1 FapA family protein [Vibrio furnissii]